MLAGVACKRSATGNGANDQAATNSSASAATSTTPLFSTKEPERYQAVRVSNQSAAELLVARDGEKRREEYPLSADDKIISLQLPTGIYLLYPTKKLYAEVKLDGQNYNAAGDRTLPPDFSPDKLLNESPGGARYEELGKEEVNGRATVKYRVTINGQMGGAKNVTTESLIWIDELLGMPIKSETTVMGGETNGAKYSTELRDIRQDVDPSLFELPPDYKKVDYKELRQQFAQNRR
jgi:hypothetical protein